MLNLGLTEIVNAIADIIKSFFRKVGSFLKALGKLMKKFFNDIKNFIRIESKSCKNVVCGCGDSPTCKNKALRVLAGCGGKCCKYGWRRRRRSCKKSRLFCGYKACKACRGRWRRGSQR